MNKMKFIAILKLCLIFLTASYKAIPTSESARKYNTDLEFNNENKKDVDVNSVNSSADTDAPVLGSNVDGDQNNKNDNTLAAWSESSFMNPEEMGGYFQGDIIVNPLLLRNSLPNETWPNGIIPYSFEGNFTEEKLATIMGAMDHYHKLTCIRFIPRVNQTDYVAIVNNETGCFSDLGHIGEPQLLNIVNECKRGNIIHELMHTIGFVHEVCRKDRDDYVRILTENIQDGKVEDFEIVPESDALQVPYDYGSILHYNEYAFSKSKTKKTIEATRNTKNIVLGQRSRLSRSDITKINKLYNCKPSP